MFFLLWPTDYCWWRRCCCCNHLRLYFVSGEWYFEHFGALIGAFDGHGTTRRKRRKHSQQRSRQVMEIFSFKNMDYNRSISCNASSTVLFDQYNIACSWVWRRIHSHFFYTRFYYANENIHQCPGNWESDLDQRGYSVGHVHRQNLFAFAGNVKFAKTDQRSLWVQHHRHRLRSLFDSPIPTYTRLLF